MRARAILIAVTVAAIVPAASRLAAAGPASRPARRRIADPYKDTYAAYRPAFLPIRRRRPKTEKEMKLSSEQSFFTLNLIDEDQRTNALIKAGLKKEAEGQYREALTIYQQVIRKFPRKLYRVSRYGVFVPASQYCQRRILGFPGGDLAFYRTLYDARAKEVFASARRRYSLLGLSDVLDTMLATSYGGRAAMELGNAALDTGHYLAALEHFTTVRDFYPDEDLHTPELALKIAYCRQMLGQKGQTLSAAAGRSALPAGQLAQLRNAVRTARYRKPPFHVQPSSPPHAATDDYGLMPASTDPMALAEPVWKHNLPGSRHDYYVYAQPVVTRDSAIYRHKNIVYCRSILNGELRWKFDTGGRAVWQNWDERQYPLEDVLAQDGLVFAVINKAGPSLVALDEVTGQLKWAYGPMVAATAEQAKMRFEAAPAGGPRTIYIGYVLDNIEGETHTDSEYGLMAFDSATGRVHWRRGICRLQPGKFAGGFVEQRRNRIRSFTSPPLYHQGTVYYNTNAGAMVALDALSGRVKWLMRYPYHDTVHDATRQFGRGGGPESYSRVRFQPHRPMFWYSQRPLLIDEDLFVAPVDSTFLFRVDRRTGKVLWARQKRVRYWRDPRRYIDGGSAYMLGPTRQGHLVLVYGGRYEPVHLVDRKTGRTVWESPDLIAREDAPVLKYRTPQAAGSGTASCYPMNERWFERSARPMLTADDKLITTSCTYFGYPFYAGATNLCVLDLKARKIVATRRYYDGNLLGATLRAIHTYAPIVLRDLQELPAKDEQTRTWIRQLKEIIVDRVPNNRYGPFLPFSRVVFSRHGVAFELRFAARSVAMVYDRPAVGAALAKLRGPRADFSKAELAVADARYDEAAKLLVRCLATMSSEDVDFRAAVNQQLYRVHKHLARRAIRANAAQAELANCIGMSRTAGSLAEEIETLFAVADAYRRAGELPTSARALRTIVSTYGHKEYPVSPLAVRDAAQIKATARGVLADYRRFADNRFFGREFSRSTELLERGLGLYFSTVSPLPKTLTLPAGELAALRLMQLQRMDEGFAGSFRRQAAQELPAFSADEKLRRLAEFPATPAAQKALEASLEAAARAGGQTGRRRMWRLADAARLAGLVVPEKYRRRLSASRPTPASESVEIGQTARMHDFAGTEGTARLVLERRGRRSIRPELMFIGGRVRKRLDNKFTLTAMDLATGRVAWDTGEFRLKGRGQEPGSFEAFVHGDRVVVHGLYDILAFALADGSLLWRYRVPFDFEIKHALLSGDLLILSGKTETLALYVPADKPNGELAWQVEELGDVYTPTYLRKDRIVSVRKLPFNVTVRYRTTGRLIGRLDVPDLSLHRVHPLIEKGPRGEPVAHHEGRLVVSDGWYYIMIDVDRLKVLWKRLIDDNDMTREPAMRFALSADYMTVIKEDYDRKAIYMLSAATGRLLWRTDPKNSRSPQPMHSIIIDGRRAYGIQPHPGQGFYFRGVDCRSGKLLFRTEVRGYHGKPAVRMRQRLYGHYAMVEIADGQDFQLMIFDATSGKRVCTLKQKGVEPFGAHGRMSATVQAGRVVLLSKDKLAM